MTRKDAEFLQKNGKMVQELSPCFGLFFTQQLGWIFSDVLLIMLVFYSWLPTSLWVILVSPPWSSLAGLCLLPLLVPLFCLPILLQPTDFFAVSKQDRASPHLRAFALAHGYAWKVLPQVPAHPLSAWLSLAQQGLPGLVLCPLLQEGPILELYFIFLQSTHHQLIWHTFTFFFPLATLPQE